MATKHNGMYRERGTYNGVKYDIHAKNKKELRKCCQKLVICGCRMSAPHIYRAFSTI